PAALAAVAAVALLAPGGRAKHRPFGPADFLGSGPVSALSSSAAAESALRPGRSDHSRRPHVGARLPGVSRAAFRDWLPASVRSGVRCQEPGGRRREAGGRRQETGGRKQKDCLATRGWFPDS